MGYFPRTKIQKAIDAALAGSTLEEYTAGDIEAAWEEDLDRCLRKVDDDEPIFVLRAQDALCVQTIRYWLAHASSLTPEHRAEVEAQLDAIVRWQDENAHRVKAPD